VRIVSGEIIVTGSVQGSDTTIDALLDAALTHVRRSRTEPGCISHHVFRDAEDANRLFFFERWADRAALDAHFAVPASREFVRALQDLATGDATMRIVETA
jgi:quinol monooxygenase YgiN